LAVLVSVRCRFRFLNLRTTNDKYPYRRISFQIGWLYAIILFIKIIQSVGGYGVQILVINSLKTYTFNLGKSNRICELKHACDIETYQLQTEEKIGPQPIKLSRKKTTTEEDVVLNEELIKICLSAVEKYVVAIQEGKFHLSMLKDRETKACQYCNIRAICRIQGASESQNIVLRKIAHNETVEKVSNYSAKSCKRKEV